MWLNAGCFRAFCRLLLRVLRYLGKFCPRRCLLYPAPGDRHSRHCRDKRSKTFFPPSPRPPSPVGKGEIISFLLQGASPLASPRLCRKVCWLTGGLRCRKGLPPALPAPSCGLRCREECPCPAVSGLPCVRAMILPPSPDPRSQSALPTPGKGGGRFLVFFCKGLRPLQPRDCAGRGTVYRAACGAGGSLTPALFARPAPGEGTISNAAVASATDSSISPGPPSPWLPLPGRKQKPFCSGRGAVSGTPEGNENPCRSRCEFGDMATARKVKAARVQLRGCKGRSPLQKITLILPLPRRGRGSGG